MLKVSPARARNLFVLIPGAHKAFCVHAGEEYIVTVWHTVMHALKTKTPAPDLISRAFSDSGGARQESFLSTGGLMSAAQTLHYRM